VSGDGGFIRSQARHISPGRWRPVALLQEHGDGVGADERGARDEYLAVGWGEQAAAGALYTHTGRVGIGRVLGALAGGTWTGGRGGRSDRCAGPVSPGLDDPGLRLGFGGKHHG
jgi:hypothetical protein